MDLNNENKHEKLTPQTRQETRQLRIESNDSDFGDAKLVQLLSASPLDELPVAELRGCTPMQVTSDATCAMGSTSSMSASLATLGAHTITISGVTSYDPVPGMAGRARAAGAR